MSHLFYLTLIFLGIRSNVGYRPAISGRCTRSSISVKAPDSRTTNEKKPNLFDKISAKFIADGVVAVAPETSSDFSFLPDSFDDAVERAAECSMKCIRSGFNRVRIDFDTTIGDMTYTSLKNSLPMTKLFCHSIAKKLELFPIEFTPTLSESESNASSESERTLRVFFPDMGAAVLARRDWKMFTNSTEVPPCVYTANMQNDPVQDSDKAVIILCPLYSEADYAGRIANDCLERNIPCIMINPNLVNMDQGYGTRARNLRTNLINTFTTAYKLRTMKKGAVVRQWPSSFSVWNEDASSDDGYSLLQCYRADPSLELLDELYDKANPDPQMKSQGPTVATAVFKEVTGFFKGLSRL